MAELFETDRTSIVRPINNIYRVDELEREATCAKIAQVQTEGKRHIEPKRGDRGQGGEVNPESWTRLKGSNEKGI